MALPLPMVKSFILPSERAWTLFLVRKAVAFLGDKVCVVVNPEVGRRVDVFSVDVVEVSNGLSSVSNDRYVVRVESKSREIWNGGLF